MRFALLVAICCGACEGSREKDADAGTAMGRGTSVDAGVSGEALPLTECPQPYGCAGGTECVWGRFTAFAEPPAEEGGLCEVPGRPSCGCLLFDQPCNVPGLSCLYPSCCDDVGLCLTREERNAVCNSRWAPRFACDQGYAAYGCLMWGPTDIVLVRAEGEDLCVVVSIAMLRDGGLASSEVEISDGWVIVEAGAGNSVSDCFWTSGVSVDRVSATRVHGQVMVELVDGNARVDADLTVEFPEGFYWLPTTAEFSVRQTLTDMCE